jgi:hypothetical protein
MNRQRGDVIVELIIYAVLAAVVAGVAWKAWDGFKVSIAKPYVDAQIKADEAVVKKANDDRDEWKRQATNAQADSAQCRDDLDVQGKTIDGWKGQAAAAQKASQDAKAKALIEAANKQTQIAEYQRQARAKDDSVKTCQQRLDAVTATLREGARSRLPGAK